MTTEDFKQFLKLLYQPVTVAALAIGFVLVLIIAGLLVLLARQSLRPQLESGVQDDHSSQVFVTELPGETDRVALQELLPVVYEVGQGDSTWRIAQAFYGDGSLYRVIELENDLVADQHLEVGMELVIPRLDRDIEQDEQQQAEQNPEQDASDLEESVDTTSEVSEVAYTVVQGDSLWQIAEAYLGDPYRWPELYQQNSHQISHPDLIYPDQVLTLPSSD